jgi:predicted metal-dependent hydrolase
MTNLIPIVEVGLWPPNYTVRKSARAKRVHVVITAQKGLEIVVPERLKRYDVNEVLNYHEQWIKKHLKKIGERKNPELGFLPTEIDLQAIQQKIQVNYIKTLGNKFRVVKNPDNSWNIMGPIENEAAVAAFLRRHLAALGKEWLIPWLRQLSLRSGLSFTAVSIRIQSTRWGSCTRLKKISLNAKLLFVPPQLVDYVLLHELSHTVHLNHSGAFWRLLARFDPEFLKNRQALREWVHILPRWVEA